MPLARTPFLETMLTFASSKYSGWIPFLAMTTAAEPLLICRKIKYVCEEENKHVLHVNELYFYKNKEMVDNRHFSPSQS